MNEDSINYPTTEALFAAVKARKKAAMSDNMEMRMDKQIEGAQAADAAAFDDSVEQILGAAGNFAYRSQCVTLGDSDAQRDADRARRDLREIVETQLRLAFARGKA